MPTVDLVYDNDCPNVKTARTNLMLAFSRVGISASWKEHQIGSAGAPAYVRGFGSPTILVDGVDVDGLAAGAEHCCRVYEGGGAPSVEVIAAALGRSGQRQVPFGDQEPALPRSRWKSTAAVLPGIGIALMPKVACPACWPVYAGFLGALGLGFLVDATYLLPLTAGFLAVAVGALAFRAGGRRGYGPFALGVLAAAIVLVGKFHWASEVTMYGGLALLIAASLWNGRPRGKASLACSCCAGSGDQQPNL